MQLAARRACSKTSDLRSSDGSCGRYYRMYHTLNRKQNGIVSAGGSLPLGKKSRKHGRRPPTGFIPMRIGSRRCPIKPMPKWHCHFGIATLALPLWHCYSGGIRVDRENCFLVTEKFGSAIRLSFLLTQVPLFCEEPVNRPHCGACRICVNNVLPVR